MVEAATSCLVAVRSAASGVPGAGLPSMPKIPAMITSRVIACIRGASAKGSPTGQRSISRSAAVGDHLRVVLDRLAVEGRQQQLALAHVARRRPRSGPSWDRGSAAAATRPVSEGACSGFAVKSERTWSGWLVMTGPPGIDAAHAEDLAELAPRREDELDLALVEAQQLGQRRQRDRSARRRRAASIGLGRRSRQRARRCVGGWRGGRAHRAKSLHRSMSAISVADQAFSLQVAGLADFTTCHQSKSAPRRRTKIIATVGPASWEPACSSS